MQTPGIPVRVPVRVPVGGGGPVGPGSVRSGITDPRNHAMPRPSTLVLRSARASDLVAVKAITNAGADRRAFGFVMRPVLEAAIAGRRAKGTLARDHLVVATQDAVVIGFMRLYHRLDGATTLHIAAARASRGSVLPRRRISRRMPGIGAPAFSEPATRPAASDG